MAGLIAYLVSPSGLLNNTSAGWTTTVKEPAAFSLFPSLATRSEQLLALPAIPQTVQIFYNRAGRWFVLSFESKIHYDHQSH